MEATLQLRSNKLQLSATKALAASARFWFIATVIGQWLFAYYIAVFYGGSALHGNVAKWKKVLTAGWVPGDTIGNTAITVHIAIAAIIMIGGPLQLVPQVRAYAPRFHRLLGRTYVLTAIVTSVVGIYMEIARPTAGDLSQHIGTAIDGVLIINCAVMAFHHAAARNFAAHQEWALRLFIVASGVWFFRVGLMFWLLVNRHPVGFNPDTFSGAFLTVLSFAEYLIPLTVLEIYLRAKSQGSPAVRWTTAIGLTTLTIAMCVGIFGAFVGMWLPHL